jgi:hypothetical protein
MTTEHAPIAAATDDNQLIAERREKLKALRDAQQRGEGVAFPNDFKPPTRPPSCLPCMARPPRRRWKPTRCAPAWPVA